MDRPPNHGHVTEALNDRRRKGAEWRRQVPLGAQAEWKAPADRTDPVEILIGQGRTRIAELLPIRYARMKADPFAFFTRRRSNHGGRPRSRPDRRTAGAGLRRLPSGEFRCLCDT